MIDFTPYREPIAEKLASYRERGLRTYATSSFQTNSVVLLHLLHELAPETPVYFLNTGFHCPETLAFRRARQKRLDLKILDLRSPVPLVQQRDSAGHQLYASDPDRCCHLNKVLPLDPILAGHDVWINGVRASQSEQRASMAEEERGRGGILRYHPLLQWNAKMIHYYIEQHALPRHPLEEAGFPSVGCEPCTRHAADLDDRGGRWAGLKKTECGLHLPEAP